MSTLTVDHITATLFSSSCRRSNLIQHCGKVSNDTFRHVWIGLLDDVSGQILHLLDGIIDIPIEHNHNGLVELPLGWRLIEGEDEDSDQAEHAMLVIGVPFGLWILFDFRAVKAMSVCEETEGI